MSISIFAKKTSRGKGGYLQRVSSMIRGVQVAEQIGAKLNPQDGYDGDTCIYVKPHVPKGFDFDFQGKKSYLDIIDGHNLGQVLLKHPEVGAIVCSRADYKIMRRSIPNEVIFIPQHHCNFDRIKRRRRTVNTVGVIGTTGAFQFLPEGLEEELKKRGMKLLKFSGFRTRQDIIDFYMKIDIQLVWRPYKKRLSNPLKLVNAMSFGVPTIALDEKAFWELRGHYVPVGNSMEWLMGELDKLVKTPGLYKDYAARGIKKAEEYHIEKVGEMYKALDK